MSLKGKTILFFAGPLYEDLELWYPKIRLEEEGARTVVAGTGEQTYQGKRGYPLTVDANVDDLSAGDFDGLVIPGGYAPDIMRRSKKLLQLTREIYDAGKPVAFICHAGWVPISAGHRSGQARHQRRRDQGRPGERRAALGGQRRRGGRQPDLLAHAGRPAPVHAGADPAACSR